MDGLTAAGTQRYPTHFTIDEAVDLCRAIRPEKALIIGMSHTVEYYHTNAMLSKLMATEGLDVQLSFDGLMVHFE